MMLYVLKSKEIMRRAVQYIASLSVDGKPFMVEIRPYDKKRTTPQNSYYWGVVLKVLGDYMGEEPDDLHDYFKFKLIGHKDKIIMGERIPGSCSTTRLTTAEFIEYTDKIRATAAVMGCHIPDPSEFGLDERVSPKVASKGESRSALPHTGA